MSEPKLVDAREALDADLREDPALREFWERTAPARAVANGLIAYRIAHDLTQTQLAARLGVKQPRTARLETGEHNPPLGYPVAPLETAGAQLSPQHRAEG